MMVTVAVSSVARKSKSEPGLKVMLLPLCETEAEEMEMLFPLAEAEASKAEPALRLRTSDESGSVSLVMTSTVREAFSSVVAVWATAVGPSLEPVTVMVAVLAVVVVPSETL